MRRDEFVDMILEKQSETLNAIIENRRFELICEEIKTTLKDAKSLMVLQPSVVIVTLKKIIKELFNVELTVKEIEKENNIKEFIFIALDTELLGLEIKSKDDTDAIKDLVENIKAELDKIIK